MKKYLLFFIAALFFPLAVMAQGTVAELKIFDDQGGLKKSFMVLPSGYQGTVDLAVGDLGGDGTAEIIIGYGGGNAPKVEIWRGSGSKISDFLAYDRSFQGGVYVAAGDLKGNKKEQIITGAGYLGGPQIRIFDKNIDKFNFFAFKKTDRAGIRILAADLGGDGKSEIIAASNFNQTAKVEVFGNDGHKIISKPLDFLNSVGGVNLAKLDYNGDGKIELAVAGGYGNSSTVYILDQNLMEIVRFSVDNDYEGGLNLAAGDINGDGRTEIIVGQSFDGNGKIIIFDANGLKLDEFTAYWGEYRAGIKVAVGDVDGDGQAEIVALPERIFRETKGNSDKYITVDLSKQKLYFWQAGYQLGNFLISSGLSKTPTPTGEFSIYNKRPKVRMSWYYGPNNPMNYDLPNVPWVASFEGPYTIHGTYWHHNFGHSMSHGCVNMYTPDAKLIYDWAPIGTPVIIY